MKILKTLTIFDWDDTLYPTFTYLERDNIEYDLLDEKIYSLLSLILEYSEVILITDASKSWVEVCLQKLPSTKKLFDSKIIIISSRDVYIQYENVFKKKLQVQNRKLKVFDAIVHYYKDCNNIISIGDSVKEYLALSAVYKKKKDKKYYKNVKLFKHSNFNLIIEQLKLLKNEFVEIYQSRNNKDILIKLDFDY